jgi:hypothetical protein
MQASSVVPWRARACTTPLQGESVSAKLPLLLSPLTYVPVGNCSFDNCSLRCSTTVHPVHMRGSTSGTPDRCFLAVVCGMMETRAEKRVERTKKPPPAHERQEGQRLGGGIETRCLQCARRARLVKSNFLRRADIGPCGNLQVNAFDLFYTVGIFVVNRQFPFTGTLQTDFAPGAVTH